MKKIIVIVFALIVAGHVNANPVGPKSPVGMSVIKSGSLVKVFYRGEESGKVRVKIYNEAGRMVFSETMKDVESFMRPYNFSSLSEGEYTIQISDESGKRFRTVSHKTKDAKRIAHLTCLRGEQCRYLLAVPNTGPDAFTVRIFDNSGDLLYQRREAVKGSFAQVYNLDAIEGEHTFEVSDANGNATRIIKSRH